MMGRIYQLNDVAEPENRWHLGTPIDSEGKEVDPRIFSEAKPIHLLNRLFIPITSGTEPLDFTFGPFDMPVVHRRVGEMLAKFEPASVQRISATVEPQLDAYDILNVTLALSCLDEAKSEVIRWKPEDGRPEKTGTYRRLGRKTLLANIIDGRKIFRFKGWQIALFVDEEVKDYMEAMGVTGVAFEEMALA